MGDSPSLSSTSIPATLADDRQEAERSVSHPRFTLSRMMIAIAVIGVALAIIMRDPGSVVTILCVASIFIAWLYAFSRLPLRLRLTFEILIACLLLGISAWVWRPPFYVYEPAEMERLAQLCSMLADRSGDDDSRARFRREAAWYRRQAFNLRLQAMWQGLIRSFTKEHPVAMTDRELILELTTLDAIEKHERIARQLEKATKNRAAGTLY